MAKALLNFSGHALSPRTVEQLQSRFDRVETIPFDSIDFEQSVEIQLRELIARVATPLDGSVAIAIVVPGQATLAALLFAYLHGLIGHFPSLCLLQADSSGIYVPTALFQIDVNAVRFDARSLRQEILRKSVEAPKTGDKGPV